MPKPAVFISEEVRAVLRLHADVLGAGFHALPIRRQLDLQAHNIVTAHARGDTAIAMHVLCWLPRAIGQPLHSVMSSPLDLADARLCMAREHGFADWRAVERLGDTTPDPVFEAAVEHLIDGELAGLERSIDARPELVRQRSSYGHRATLLHYIGANGVESHRQRTPLDAVRVAELLLRRGADVNAEAEMYGGGSRTLGLVATSSHPHDAGVQRELEDILRRAGGR